MRRVLVLSAVTLAVIVGLITWSASRRARNGRGRAEGAWWVDDASGALLVLADAVPIGRSERFRVVTVDPRDGRRLATRVFDWSMARCAPASRGRLWCGDRKTLLVDARTLGDIGLVTDLFRRAGFEGASDDRLTLDDDAALAVLADGRVARLDVASLTVTLAPSVGDAPGLSLVKNGDQWCRTHGETTLGGALLRFGDGPRRALLLQPSGASRATPATTTFLDPVFLGDTRGGPPVLAAAGAAIVAHVSSFDAVQGKRQLSRVDAKGNVTWTVDLAGRCQLATVDGDRLVVATTDGARRMSAFDLASGAPRWSVTFD